MKYYSFLVILLTLSFLACDKGDEDTSEKSSSISGSVTLCDQGQTNVDNSNMKVSIEGTSPLLSVETDANGEFIINDVPFGTYNLIFEKPNYGTYKFFDVTLTESGGPYMISEIIKLGQKSDLTINSFSVYISHGKIDYTGDIDPAGTEANPKYVRIFYSTNENVSNTNYTFYSEPYIVTSNRFEIPITNEELLEAGFDTGSTVFLKIYGDSYWSNSYEQPGSGEMIFPNLSADSPEATSFVVP